MKKKCAGCRLSRVFVQATFSVGVCLLLAVKAQPDLISSLYERGYSVIPEPQQVELRSDDFRISGDWRVERGPEVEPGSPAENVLRTGLEQRHAFKFSGSGSGPPIRLEVKTGSVPLGNAQDK